MTTHKYPGDMISFLENYYGDRSVVGAEIGVLNGDHALRMLESDILRIEKLYLIDPYRDYNDYHDHNRSGLDKALRTAIRELAPYSGQVKWLFLKSEDATQFINQPLSFCYIDGNHSKPYVTKDLWGYLPLIRDDGIIGGHDYYTRKDPDNLCEVEEFVNEFAKVFDSTLYLDGTCEVDWPDWWFVKDANMTQRLVEAFSQHG